MKHEHGSCGHGSCGCPCHKMGGIFIALIGLAFLLGALDVISQKMVNVAWPSLLILVGLKHSAKGMCKCCAKG